MNHAKKCVIIIVNEHGPELCKKNRLTGIENDCILNQPLSSHGHIIMIIIIISLVENRTHN